MRWSCSTKAAHQQQHHRLVSPTAPLAGAAAALQAPAAPAAATAAVVTRTPLQLRTCLTSTCAGQDPDCARGQQQVVLAASQAAAATAAAAANQPSGGSPGRHNCISRGHMPLQTTPGRLFWLNSGAAAVAAAVRVVQPLGAAHLQHQVQLEQSMQHVIVVLMLVSAAELLLLTLQRHQRRSNCSRVKGQRRHSRPSRSCCQHHPVTAPAAAVQDNAWPAVL